MRLVRMFGVAVIATVVTMAFVGASSAMAVTELEKVVLCNENVSPCPAGHDFESPTVFHGELKTGTKAVLLASTQIECPASTTLGITDELLVHGEITALTFEKCKTNTGVACAVVKEHLNYLIKGELNATHSGYEAVVTGLNNGQPQATVVCGTIIECKYGETSVLFTAEPEAGDMVLSVLQELTGVGPLCGTIVHPVWHAKYLTRCLEGSSLVGCWLEME